MLNGSSSTKWCCTECGKLLGVIGKDDVTCRFKSVSYFIRGEVTTHCRGCGKPNHYSTITGIGSAEATTGR